MNQTEPDTVRDVMQILGEPDSMFPNNQQIGEKSVEDVFGSKPNSEARELIGYLTISLTGGGRSISVPHAELVTRMEELGFPSQFIPSEPSSDRAFRRSINELSSILSDTIDFSFNETCKLSLRTGEENHRQHLIASYFDSEGAQAIDLGNIWYNSEEEKVYPMPELGYNEPELNAAWNTASNKITALFDHYKQNHTSADITSLQETLRNKATDHMKLRPAVYFYPATTQGFERVLESFSELYAWIDRHHKSRGEQAFFSYTQQFNQRRNRQLLGERLRRELKSEIEVVVTTIGQPLSSDTTPEERARSTLQPRLRRMDARLTRLESISEPTPCLHDIIEETLAEVDSSIEERARMVIDEAAPIPGGAK